MSGKPPRESVEAQASVVGLALPSETVGAVQANFELLAQLAHQLDDVPLNDSADEPATTFVPR